MSEEVPTQKEKGLASGGWSAFPKHKAIVAILLVWAVAVSSSLAWVSYQNQIDTWNSQALLLREIGAKFGRVSVSIQKFLETKDPDWAEEGRLHLATIFVNWLHHSTRVSSVTQALGITVGNIATAKSAYKDAAQFVREDPSLLDGPSATKDYLDAVRPIYSSLAESLLDIEAIGTDPIAQLGGQRVVLIRDLMTELCALSNQFSPGLGCD